jgi:glucosamine--fructose-6-phosphate aminotransferase (isomerizing)
MATSSLIGRRVFLAAAKRSTYQQALQSSALRAASTTSHYSHGDSSSSSAASRFGLLGAAGAFALAANATNEKADCCGIAGVVGAKGDARDYLIEGLTILKNRGYDSAGIATMDDANPELVVSYFFVSTSHFMFCRSAHICYIYPFTSNNSPSSPPPSLLTPGYQIRLRR